MSEFEWPCDLRIAHGPHTTDDGEDCPGVKAHPATMIGGRHVDA